MSVGNHLRCCECFCFENIVSLLGPFRPLICLSFQVSVMKKIAENEDNSKIMEHLIELGRVLLNKNNLK